MSRNARRVEGDGRKAALAAELLSGRGEIDRLYGLRKSLSVAEVLWLIQLIRNRCTELSKSYGSKLLDEMPEDCESELQYSMDSLNTIESMLVYLQ